MAQAEFQSQFTAMVQSLAFDGGAPVRFAMPLVEYITARLPQGTTGKGGFFMRHDECHALVPGILRAHLQLELCHPG